MVMNERDRSSAVVGAFVLAAAIAFGTLFVAATNRSLDQRRAELWIELPTAEGLKKGDALLYRGVHVGEVKRLDFSGHGGSSIAVRAVLVRAVPLTTAASARLVPADMFGRQTVVLAEGIGGRPLQSGDTLRGTPPVSLTARIDGVAARLERAVGDTTVDAVHALLAEAGATLAELRHTLLVAQSSVHAQQAPLASALSSTAAAAANVSAATDSAALIALRTRAHGTIERLESLAARLDTASAAVLRTMARLDSGEGSMGLLAGDPALYHRAVATLESFESLITDIRRNPKRYINVSVF